jgi:hypothetical protein
MIDDLTHDIAVRLQIMREAVRARAEKDPSETTV